jgi:hypothetical protein
VRPHRADVPLTVRDCADWMGYSTEWVRRAIHRGVTAPDGSTVKLAAVSLRGRVRRSHRIHLDDFVAFLLAIGSSKIPRQHAPPYAHAHAPDHEEA